MSPVEHRVRNSLLDKETTFRLSDDALVLDDGGKKESVPYSDIERLNLITYAADIADPQNVHGQLTIRLRSGKSLKLRSHHFKGVGSFESRSQTYAPFVRDLSRRVDSQNPAARFATGATSMRLLWLALMVPIGLVGVFLGIALIAEGWRWDIALACLAAALLVHVAWKRLRANREAEFDPADPPAELLEL